MKSVYTLLWDRRKKNSESIQHSMENIFKCFHLPQIIKISRSRTVLRMQNKAELLTLLVL